jgi:hypothetical protein
MRTADVPAASVPYSSPLWLLDALRGTCDDARIVGDDEVRATPTTHIRLTIDTARAIASSPNGLRPPALRADSFPAEVWLDREGRIRRMARTLGTTV